jgi:hypothetical protein
MEVDRGCVAKNQPRTHQHEPVTRVFIVLELKRARITILASLIDIQKARSANETALCKVRHAN